MTVDPAEQPEVRDAPPPAPPETAPPAPPPEEQPITLRRSRAGFAWTAFVIAAIVGILLLVFILENLHEVRVHLLFWWISLPAGVGALLAALVGALIMALVGGVRIWQLRRVAAKALANPR
jgi:uncharacterized integral membrane protein